MYILVFTLIALLSCLSYFDDNDDMTTQLSPGRLFILFNPPDRTDIIISKTASCLLPFELQVSTYPRTVPVKTCGSLLWNIIPSSGYRAPRLRVGSSPCWASAPSSATAAGRSSRRCPKRRLPPARPRASGTELSSGLPLVAFCDKRCQIWRGRETYSHLLNIVQ